jgi:2-methylcitrate dehydratase
MIGGGQYLDPMTVRTKEDADHSLPYLMAVTILDREVTPRQFEPERICRSDVQDLLRKVSASPDDQYTDEYPGKMRCKISIELADGRKLEREKQDYLGFAGRPMHWDDAVAKFELLTAAVLRAQERQKVIRSVAEFESRSAREFMTVLREFAF